MLTRAVLLLFCAAAVCSCGEAHSRVAHVIRFKPVDVSSASPQDLDRSVSIIRDRLRRLGLRKFHVGREGRFVAISLRKIPSAALLDAATRPARLEIYDLEPSLAEPSRDPSGHPGASTSRPAVQGHEVVVTCGQRGDRFCPGVSEAPPRRIYYYVFRHDPSKGIPALTNADLDHSARQNYGQAADPIVRLVFTARGSRKFQQLTRNAYRRGLQRNWPQHFAIVLDRDIKSFPQIDYTDPQLADGISGGGQITGIGSIAKANDLALVLQTDALPVKFVRVR